MLLTIFSKEIQSILTRTLTLWCEYQTLVYMLQNLSQMVIIKHNSFQQDKCNTIISHINP